MKRHGYSVDGSHTRVEVLYRRKSKTPDGEIQVTFALLGGHRDRPPCLGIGKSRAADDGSFLKPIRILIQVDDLDALEAAIAKLRTAAAAH